MARRWYTYLFDFFLFASYCAAQMPHIVVLLFAKFLWKNHPWLILTLLLNRRQVCDPKRICPSLLEIYFFMAFSKCSHEQKGVPSKVPYLKKWKKKILKILDLFFMRGSMINYLVHHFNCNPLLYGIFKVPSLKNWKKMGLNDRLIVWFHE